MMGRKLGAKQNAKAKKSVPLTEPDEETLSRNGTSNNVSIFVFYPNPPSQL